MNGTVFVKGGVGDDFAPQRVFGNIWRHSHTMWGC